MYINIHAYMYMFTYGFNVSYSVFVILITLYILIFTDLHNLDVDHCTIPDSCRQTVSFAINEDFDYQIIEI